MRWSWGGAVALVLATAVGIGWAAISISVALDPGQLTTVGRDMFYTLGGVIVGSVATWLGGKRRRGDRDDDRPEH